MCAYTGGYLPIARTESEFNSLFYAFQGKKIKSSLSQVSAIPSYPGKNKPILWGEPTKVGDQLFWCQGNATVAVPVAVSGSTSQPFFLVSFARDQPNLYAVPLGSDVRTNHVVCLYEPEIKEACDSKKRPVNKNATMLESFLAKYKITIEGVWAN